MSAVLPDLIGFCVRIGTSDDPLPAFLSTSGTRVQLGAVRGGTALAGTGLSPLTAVGAGEGGLAVDRDLVAVLAGELYHREAIETAVGEHGSGTDAELLLSCYRRYGVAGFRLLNGRFAAVVLGPRRLVLAADHAASVPLYVRVSEREVWVATEAKALAAASGGPVGVAHMLAGAVPVPGSPGLQRVRAGTVLVFDPPLPLRPDATRTVRTWVPPVSRIVVDPGRAVAAVTERLDAAVRSRQRGETYTVVLSGGIDSAALAALASAAGPPVQTVSLGTDVSDEFEAARVVASHVEAQHTELKVAARGLLDELPFAVAAAEIQDPDILEYLLPLVALYRRLPGPPRRILTGYGADIPLGGMHRSTVSLEELDERIAYDMAAFDGLNELSPVLSGIAGHWSTHPYWDRDLLELLLSLEPGLKRRDGQDKWVLRSAMVDRLPAQTRQRRKLGIHEGSGLSSTWSEALRGAGVAAETVPAGKRAMAQLLYKRVVLAACPPEEVDMNEIWDRVVR